MCVRVSSTLIKRLLCMIHPQLNWLLQKFQQEDLKLVVLCGGQLFGG